MGNPQGGSGLENELHALEQVHDRLLYGASIGTGLLLVIGIGVYRRLGRAMR